MKKTIHAALVVALFSSTAVIALTPAPVLAQAAAAAPKMSDAVNKKLAEASKLVAAEKLDEAMVLVKDAQALPNLNETDKFSINKFVGLISFKKDDFASAEAAYDAMARSTAMPAAERLSTLRTAAGFASQADHHDKVIEYAAMGEAAGLNDEQLHKAATQAHLQKNDYRSAEAAANKALAASKAAGGNPSRDTLFLLYQAQAGQNNNATAEATLQQMAFLYGDKQDWGYAISQAIGTTGANDYTVLHMGRLMLAADAKTEASDYKLFGESANRLGYLGDAVTALDKGATGLPANVRPNSIKDKASMPAAEAEAAKTKDGNVDIANAHSFYGYGDYVKATASARAGIAKGGLKDPVEAQMVLGESLVAQGHYSDAIPIFNGIQSPNAAMKKAAYLWAGFAQQKLSQVSARPAAPAAQ